MANWRAKRTVLIATSNNAPEQVDGLLGWLDSDVQRWSALTGDVLITAPGRDPMLVNTDATAPPPGATEDRMKLYLGIGAGVVALAAVGTGLILLRNRRSLGRIRHTAWCCGG